MSDKEFGGSDDLSLPKATVQKIITEVLNSPSLNPSAQPMTMTKESRDLLIEACVEFITMLSSEANEMAEKDAKKTIAHEHIVKALEELGFEDYVGEIGKVAEEFKKGQVNRERKQTKIEKSGLSEGELIKAQEALFAQAGEKYQPVGGEEMEEGQ